MAFISDDFIPAAKAQEILGFSGRGTVYRLAREGKIEMRKVGKGVYFSVADVLKYKEENRPFDAVVYAATQEDFFKSHEGLIMVGVDYCRQLCRFLPEATTAKLAELLNEYREWLASEMAARTANKVANPN